MTARSLLTTIACFLFCAFLQFGGTLAPFPWVWFAGGISAAVFFLLMGFFEVELPQSWQRVIVASAASLAGVAAGFLSGNREPMVWWAVAAAGTVALVWWLVGSGLGQRCHLCNRWLRRSVVSFECPRCGFVVCEQCWDFDHVRCRLCKQNHVPAFSPDARWWDQHLGARAAYGRCQICLTTGDLVDLRSCGRCGRQQCRECWDNANGECSRCHWLVDDLPATLRPYMLKAPVTSSPEN